MSTKLKIILFTVAGALAGYAYYYFIGCRTGTCTLTSTWYITTGYGAFTGLILGFPGKKSKKQNENESATENN